MEKSSKESAIMKDSPLWLQSGLLIFPIILIIGIIIRIFGGDNMLFVGAIVPSSIFEETFERCCTSIADNQILNLFFIVIFWFAIGAGIGLIIEKIRKRPRSRRGSDN